MVGFLAALAAALLPVTVPATLRGQEETTDCTVLCRRALTVEPGVAVEPVFRSPRVAELDDGMVVDTVRERTSSELELTLAVGIPARIPRTEVGFDVTGTPFVETEENPFTGRAAEEAGVEGFRANVIEFSPEVSSTLLTAEQTEGWSELALAVSDDISPAETPDAGSLFTHKLALALDWTIAVLGFLPKENWLRHVELEGSLDFQATGVPEAGDAVPKGERRFLDDGARWGIAVVAITPLAPLSP